MPEDPSDISYKQIVVDGYNASFSEDPDELKALILKYLPLVDIGISNEIIVRNVLRNEYCPFDTIKYIFDSYYKSSYYDQYGFYSAIMKNPKTPLELIEKVINGNFSFLTKEYAANNPNCPPKLKIKWMQDSGQIEKEGKDHIVDYSGKEEDNLDALRNLANTNNNAFNLKKYSNDVADLMVERDLKDQQNPIFEHVNKSMRYYNIVQETKDPNEIRRIVDELVNERDVSSEHVMFEAIKNIHIPLDSLLKLVDKEPWYIKSIIRILEIPSTKLSPEYRLNLLKAIGAIEKEDPNKHAIDKTEDNLDKLRNLASNTFNLNKYSQVSKEETNDGYINKMDKIVASIDSEYLRYIIDENRENVFVEAALRNPYCPIDILKMTIMTNYNNRLACAVVSNPNCPKELMQKCVDRSIYKERNNQTVNSYIVEETYCALENPNCPSDILISVINSNLKDSVKKIALNNPNCPPEAVIKWHQENDLIEKEDPTKHIVDKNDDPLDSLRNLANINNIFNLKVSQDQIKNPPQFTTQTQKSYRDILQELRTTKDIDLLKRIMDLGTYKDSRIFACVENPNMPAELLIKWLDNDEIVTEEDYPDEDFLDRGMTQISQKALEHPNLPPEYKIKYMRDHNLIEQEDHNKHIIDQTEDNLDKLRNLSNTKFNLNKYSQNEDYYNTYTARHTKDPEVLRKILTQGKLDRFDIVAQHGVINPNCPPDILRKILEDRNGVVCWYAASNPNCPPDLLRKILEKGGHDSVSVSASKNPNSPLDAKIKWMRATGNIEKEDPTKHIVDEPLDNLQRLKDLNARKNINMNKYANNLKAIDSLKNIINALKMSGLSHIDQTKITQINERIKQLPQPETIDKFKHKPNIIQQIQKEVGKIQRLIEIYSQRDENSKIQYKALTGLNPRYNIQKLEPIMNQATQATTIKELVKLSSILDEKGHSSASSQLIKVAKNVKNSSEEELFHHINIIANDLSKNGYEEDAKLITEAGIWQGIKDSVGNFKNMMMDSIKLSQIKDQITKSINSINGAYIFIEEQSQNVRNPELQESINSSLKGLGSMLTSGQDVLRNFTKLQVAYKVQEKQEAQQQNPQQNNNQFKKRQKEKQYIDFDKVSEMPDEQLKEAFDLVANEIESRPNYMQNQTQQTQPAQTA